MKNKIKKDNKYINILKKIFNILRSALALFLSIGGVISIILDYNVYNFLILLLGLSLLPNIYKTIYLKTKTENSFIKNSIQIIMPLIICIIYGVILPPDYKVEKSKKCTKKVVGSNIYFYCIEDIQILDDSYKYFSLKENIKNKNNALSKMISDSINYVEYEDNTILYNADDYSIVKCYNNEIIVSSPNLEMLNGFCDYKILPKIKKDLNNKEEKKDIESADKVNSNKEEKKDIESTDNVNNSKNNNDVVNNNNSEDKTQNNNSNIIKCPDFEVELIKYDYKLKGYEIDDFQKISDPQWIAIYLKVKNTSESKLLIGTNQFKLINSNGEYQKPNSTYYKIWGDYVHLDSPTLAVGGEKTGFIQYSNSNTDNSKLKIEVNCDDKLFFDDTKIIKNLN